MIWSARCPVIYVAIVHDSNYFAFIVMPSRQSKQNTRLSSWAILARSAPIHDHAIMAINKERINARASSASLENNADIGKTIN